MYEYSSCRLSVCLSISACPRASDAWSIVSESNTRKRRGEEKLGDKLTRDVRSQTSWVQQLASRIYKQKLIPGLFKCSTLILCGVILQVIYRAVLFKSCLESPRRLFLRLNYHVSVCLSRLFVCLSACLSHHVIGMYVTRDLVVYIRNNLSWLSILDSICNYADCTCVHNLYVSCHFRHMRVLFFLRLIHEELYGVGRSTGQSCFCHPADQRRGTTKGGLPKFPTRLEIFCQWLPRVVQTTGSMHSQSTLRYPIANSASTQSQHPVQDG